METVIRINDWIFLTIYLTQMYPRCRENHTNMPYSPQLQSRHNFGKLVLRILFMKIMVAIFDFNGSGVLGREINLYQGGKWWSKLRRGVGAGKWIFCLSQPPPPPLPLSPNKKWLVVQTFFRIKEIITNLRSSSLLNTFSSAPQEMYKEQYRKRAYWYWGAKGYVYTLC